MTPLFITATGTGMGKTAVTTALCWQLRAQNQSVAAIKPVISGYKENDLTSDSALILQSCGITPTPEAVHAISPWRYEAPLAPNLAAAREGNPIDLPALVDFCRDYEALTTGQLFIEGVGGIHAPLTNQHTVADWMEALNWPVILICGSYLGALSHTLSTLEVLRYRGLKVKALIISESENSSVSLQDTATTLEQFVQHTTPVLQIPRLSASANPWQHWPHLSWICG